jgi:hypothetical protein
VQLCIPTIHQQHMDSTRPKKIFETEKKISIPQFCFDAEKSVNFETLFVCVFGIFRFGLG